MVSKCGVDGWDGHRSDLFFAKVQIGDDGCWRWIANLNECGYGKFYFRGKSWLAHRVSYVAHVDEIPSGLEVDHLCGNRCCVNPAHLEAVTHAENIRRGRSGEFQKSKTHCKRGHEFTPENTLRVGVRRHCRECKRMYAAMYRRGERVKG